MKFLLLSTLALSLSSTMVFAFDAYKEIELKHCNQVEASAIEACVSQEIFRCVAVADSEAEPAVSSRQCAHAAFEQADRLLNDVYQDAIEHVNSIYEQPSDNENSGFEELVREAQRAWVSMRMTSCALGPWLVRGTGGDGESTCAAIMSLQRVRFLQDDVLSVPSFK